MKKIKIGVIGVDAGLCWIGDPCYIFHKKGKELEDLQKIIGKDWKGFCDTIDQEKPFTAYKYSRGREGLGLAVSTGYGDGEYPVYAEIEDGHITSITINFMEGEENE